MATGTATITATATAATTLTNPVSLDELQLLGQPTINVDGTVSVEGLMGTSEGYYVMVEPTQVATDNGGRLLDAYTTAKNLTGLSATQRATVIVPPGNYDLGTTSFTMDAQYVDVVGLGGNPRSVIVDYTGATILDQTATDIRVSGIWFRGSIHDSGGDTTNVFSDCIFGVSASTNAVGSNETLPGTFIRCRFENVGKSTNHAKFSGICDHCEFEGTNSTYIANGGVWRYCVCDHTAVIDSGDTASVYLCAISTFTETGTNDIGTPNNVTDTDIEL